MTKGYIKYCKKLQEISWLPAAVEAMEFLKSLPGEQAQEIRDDLAELVAPFKTGRKCPRCGGALYVSDLPQYENVCYSCDENFY